MKECNFILNDLPNGFISCLCSTKIPCNVHLNTLASVKSMKDLYIFYFLNVNKISFVDGNARACDIMIELPIILVTQLSGGAYY